MYAKADIQALVPLIQDHSPITLQWTNRHIDVLFLCLQYSKRTPLSPASQGASTFSKMWISYIIRSRYQCIVEVKRPSIFFQRSSHNCNSARGWFAHLLVWDSQALVFCFLTFSTNFLEWSLSSAAVTTRRRTHLRFPRSNLHDQGHDHLLRDPSYRSKNNTTQKVWK